MRNSPDTVAAIRRVFDQAAGHITGINCCRGCTLARQIPGLLDDIAELRAELDEAWQGGYKTGRRHAANLCVHCDGAGCPKCNYGGI